MESIKTNIGKVFDKILSNKKRSFLIALLLSFGYSLTKILV